MLVLTGPCNEERFVEDVQRLTDAGYGWDNAYICRVHSRSTFDVWLADSPAEVLDQSWWQVFTGPLWTQGERLRPPEPSSRGPLHRLSCLTFVRR
jgi:hypothetical protein